MAAILATWSLGVLSAQARPALQGVNLHSLWWDNSLQDMSRELSLSQQIGSTAVRVDIDWDSLETGGRGQLSPWYVRKLDSFIAGARARGLQVIATVWGTPCWASSAPDSLKQGCTGHWWDRGVPSYPPVDNADYARIVQWLTARYGSGLTAVEIWTEPDLNEHFFWRGPDQVHRYAELVKAGYVAAKAGNPAVKVLAGAMSRADRPFLEQLYRYGIEGYYDAISLHPYSGGESPDFRYPAPYQKYAFEQGIKWLHAGQLAAGDNTPLWLTEFGWSTCRPAGYSWCVTDQQRSRYLQQAFSIIDRLDYVKAAIVYNLRDEGTDPSSLEDNWGLVRPNFAPTSGLSAVRRALSSSPIPAPRARPPAPSPLRLRIRLHRRWHSVFVRAHVTRRARVRIRLRGHCRLTGKAIEVRLRHAGAARRRLGFIGRVRGCRVHARVAHPRRLAVSRRVR